MSIQSFAKELQKWDNEKEKKTFKHEHSSPKIKNHTRFRGLEHGRRDCRTRRWETQLGEKKEQHKNQPHGKTGRKRKKRGGRGWEDYESSFSKRVCLPLGEGGGRVYRF